MTVFKSRLVQAECRHHGITEFYDYGKSRVCATCAREKKRVRDSLNRIKLNKKERVTKSKKFKKLDYTLSEYFIDKYKETIDSIVFIYKIKYDRSKLIKGVGETTNASQFLVRMKDYYYNKCKSKLMGTYGWNHSTVLKYRYNVRENYKDASEELKSKIRRETHEMSTDSVKIPLQVLKDRVDALPIIKDDTVKLVKPKQNSIKQEIVFPPKYTTPNEITGFIGVKKIEQKRKKSLHTHYFIATFRNKQIGFYDTAEQAAIAYNNEVIKAYGDYAVSGGILNKVNKETTYLGCKGVTLKNGKYVARLEHKGKEVYNKLFDDFNTAIKEYDREVIKHFGKDSDKLNYKIVTTTVTTCSNIPRKYIKKRIKKNKPSTWLVSFSKYYIGAFVSELDACLAYNKAVIDFYGEDVKTEDLVVFETSNIRERIKVGF